MDYEPAQRLLVVPEDMLAQLPAGDFVSDDTVVRQFLADVRGQGSLVNRDVAERDPRLIQLIALAYIEHRDGLVVLPRDETDASHKLYGKQAIWVGGHVEAQDCLGWRDHTGAVVANPITDGLRRELDEELGLEDDLLSPPELVGLVRDSGSERSRMHLGIVFRAFARDDANAALAVPARMQVRGRCSAEVVSLAVLRARYERLEPWSRSILYACFGQRSPALMVGNAM